MKNKNRAQVAHQEINSHLEKWVQKKYNLRTGALSTKKLEEKINELADFDEDTFHLSIALK